MMTLADISAMRVWAMNPKVERDQSISVALDWSDSTSAEMLAALKEELGIAPTRGDPVHVLVGDAANRPRGEWVQSHTWSGNLPPGSLIRLVPEISVISPELCFLQMAGRRSIPEIAAIGMELTGKYGRVPTARGFLDREPVTSINQLRAFLDQAVGMYGAKRARRALTWVLPNSRSPMETALALTLTLPRRYGGYGLPRPELNYRVVRPPEFLMLSQSPWYELDICWPKKKVSTEYDSYENHMSMAALDHDSMKFNSLMCMDWRVYSATKGQMSGTSLDILANQLAMALGVHPQPPKPELRDSLVSALTRGRRA